jgi:hypothetical protein
MSLRDYEIKEKEIEKIKEKVEAKNELNEYINRFMPLVMEELKKGYSTNKDGGFDKRTLIRLDKVYLATKKANRIKVSREVSTTDVVYKISAPFLYDKRVTVINFSRYAKKQGLQDFTPLTDFVTLEQTLANFDKINEIKLKISALEQEKRDLERYFYDALDKGV